MDLIDQLKYGEMEVDEKLSKSYSETFNGSDASNEVLKDLMITCGYGMYSKDKDEKLRIIERNTVIFRIKAMLNGLPTEPEKEEEYE